MGKISVVINVIEPEIDVLPRALNSIRTLADEIVLVDMTSSSKLREIAGKYSAVVHKHKKEPYVEIARNFGIHKAKNEWILVMDPDEEITPSLAMVVKKIIKNPDADYYRLPRKNIIFGKWIKHSRWWPDMNIRLFKKGHVSWNEIIHAVPLTTGVGKDLEVKEENGLIHFHHERVEQYIERLNRYTTQQAKNIYESGYEFDWRDIVKKPINEFLSRYFQGEGYKDGLHGLALCLLQAFSELVLYLKVWQLDNFKEQHADLEEVIAELKESESDLHYWESDALLKEVGGLKHRIKRKLKL